MNKLTLFILVLLFSFMNVNAQNPLDRSGWALKTNLLYDLTTTINVGFETRISDKMTIDVPVSINPWNKTYGMKLKHLMVQPEFRYWLNEEFDMHFFGAHVLYAKYNMADVKLPFNIYEGLKDNQYEGDAIGVGLSYGCHFYINQMLRLEGTIGFGYIHFKYDKTCLNCEHAPISSSKNYFGPTKAGVSLIYMIAWK